MKFLKKSPSVFLLFLVSKFLSPLPVHAQTSPWSSRCVANGDVATIQGFECLFGNVVSVVILFAGLAFFGMFIYGGFQYLTSSNDDKKVAAASSTLTLAVVGLVGAVASYLILNFIQKFTGANVTNFIIPPANP